MGKGMCGVVEYRVRENVTSEIITLFYLSFCNGFEITLVLEKHVGEDDVLFTNHLAGK